MLVWSMSVMSTIKPSFDLEKVPLRLVDPRITEVVVPVEPPEFPMKAEYERINGTIEGLRNRDEPEIEDQEEEGDEGGNDDDDDEGKGDKPKESKESSKEKPELLHYSEGVASDGIIYVKDLGDEVKLDSKGRAYKVGSDERKLMPSKRLHQKRPMILLERKSKKKIDWM